MAPAPDLLVGCALESRYRVHEQIARGGMSTVYAATDERLDRLVAVKVMNSALSADPAFSDRFAREARAAARLTHGNVVSVHDQGEDVVGGQRVVFLVMELVRGRTLRELLRERGRLSPAQAVSVLEPVLLALAAAHRAGLVHRDVKPENILLADDGTVKVADFGLARAVETDASATRTGLMMGTVAYCPPEQITQGRNDPRSDVYSAGVVAFELLTGRTPYRGGSAMEIAYRHVHDRVPRASTLVDGIPVQLDELVQRATTREPGGRPLDAGALLAELSDVRVDLALPVTPVPPRPSAGGRGPDAPTATLHPDRRHPDGRTPDGRHPDGRHPDGRRPVGVGAGTATEALSVGARSTSLLTGRAPGGQTTAGLPGAGVTEWIGSRSGAGHDTVVEERVGGRDRGEPGRPRPVRRRRRGLIALLLVLLLGAAVAYGSWWLTAGRYATVPSVAGQSVAGATDLLEQAGYRVQLQKSSFSESVAKGAVIDTDPAPGVRRVRGAAVGLNLSLGKERFLVPDVVGQTQADARLAFASIPVSLKVVSVPSDTVAAGSVVAVDPGRGSQVKRDAVITVQVSSGLPLVDVPDVTGQPGDQAAATLQQAGFTSTRSEAYSDSVDSGDVISQDPSGGQLRKFSTVSITVSLGPPLVTIPSIAPGTDSDTARAELEGLGLHVKVQKSFGAPLHKFVAIDPGEGTQVTRGSSVTIYVV